MDAKNELLAALRRQYALEDERRSISRDLCGVRAEIRRLLGMVGAQKQKGRPMVKQGGKVKSKGSILTAETVHGEISTRKRKGRWLA